MPGYRCEWIDVHFHAYTGAGLLQFREPGVKTLIFKNVLWFTSILQLKGNLIDRFITCM